MASIFSQLLHDIHPVLHYVYRFATQHGYLSLTIIAMTDGAGIPIMSELVLLAFISMVHQGQIQFWPALLMTATANTVGALCLFAVARWSGSRLVSRWVPEGSPMRQRVYNWLTNYGVLAIVLTRVTSLLRLPTIAMAGILRMSTPVLTVALFVASCLWLYLGYYVVQLMGVEGARLIMLIRGHWIAAAVVCSLLIAAAITFWASNRRHPRDEDSDGTGLK